VLAICERANIRFVMERAWRDPTWGKFAVNLRNVGPLFDSYMKAQVSLEIAATVDTGEMAVLGREMAVHCLLASELRE